MASATSVVKKPHRKVAPEPDAISLCPVTLYSFAFYKSAFEALALVMLNTP